MTIYMIRGETVTAHAAAPAKPPKGSLTIRSADDIASSDLPASRLVAIWNALPGAPPVIKFKDRKTAARRLRAAFQLVTGPIRECLHCWRGEGALDLPQRGGQ